MSHKTLPAITAEIEAEFEKLLPLIVEDYNNFITEAGEIGEMDIEDIVSERIKPLLGAALLKVANETKEAITPKRAGGGIGPAVIDIPAENFVNGHNICRREIDANFKTFINQ
jgi:hypothetical protein